MDCVAPRLALCAYLFESWGKSAVVVVFVSVASVAQCCIEHCYAHRYGV